MLQDYLTGSVAQTAYRAKQLIAKIPRNLPRDYAALDQTCRTRVNALVRELQALLDQNVYGSPTVEPVRLRRFRRLVADLDLLESTAIMALARAEHDDYKFNRLLEKIRLEISYPLPAPVVSTLSQQYFQIDTTLNLLFVPLTEGDFLLHLPDLYHELAHPLLTVQNDPAIEPFQMAFLEVMEHVIGHLGQLERDEERRHGPKFYAWLVKVWEESWLPYWLTEFFCDAFATYTVGPAYAWGHLHLSAKRGENPFEVIRPSKSHPPDDARMRVMLSCLRTAGFEVVAKNVEATWYKLLQDGNMRSEPEYRRCLPDDLLADISAKSKQGIERIGCRIAVPETSDEVHNLLNQAWDRFWAEPATYVKWERQEVKKLYAAVAN